MQVELKEPEIVVGALVSPNTIKTQTNEVINISEWDFRAMWSLLRLQFNRSIDDKIKTYCREQATAQYKRPYVTLKKEEKALLVNQFFVKTLDQVKDPRQVQFIMSDGDIKAVASTKHILIPPRQVYDMAELVIEEKHPELILSDQDGLLGMNYQIPELQHTGFDLGLQVFGGDIFTRSAISLSSWLRVKLCFNPLSWLGSGSLSWFAGQGRDIAERMLRIEALNQFKPRLAQAIDLQLQKTKVLEDRVEVAKQTKVQRSDAEVIMAAMGLSYSLGGSTIDQILDRLQQEEPTVWGMSMASSYVASHGKLKSREDDSKVVQKLSTISGAAILLKDIPKVSEQSVEWLSKHIKLGDSKTLNDLANRVKLWEKAQP